MRLSLSIIAMSSEDESFSHPRDILVQVMSRMYGRLLTTSSGGNASIKDAEGCIWMTPKGNDKGSLTRDEIAYQEANSNEWKGNYPPSSEWPFHTRAYQARPDVRAVLHAHSQTLVAFSVANRLPDTFALSQAANLCGSVGLAHYAMPGSDALADTVTQQVVKHDCIIMANHGVVVVGWTMAECYEKFEALEFCARAQVRAGTLGGFKQLLTRDDMEAQAIVTTNDRNLLIESEYSRPVVTTKECDLRATLAKFVRRSYEQGLIHSQSGAMSARLTPTSFLITPSGIDRQSIQPSKIVLITFPTVLDARVGVGAHAYAQPGLTPSRAWAVHNAMYQEFPDTHAIMHAHPFHIAAFCMTNVDFPPNVIPESYIVLRNVGRISFLDSLDKERVIQAFKDNDPCSSLLVDNDGIMVQGKSLEQVFDRLEVLEATANVVLECKALGETNLMTKEQTQAIDEVWFGGERIQKKHRQSSTK